MTGSPPSADPRLCCSRWLHRSFGELTSQIRVLLPIPSVEVDLPSSMYNISTWFRDLVANTVPRSPSHAVGASPPVLAGCMSCNPQIVNEI